MEVLRLRCLHVEDHGDRLQGKIRPWGKTKKSLTVIHIPRKLADDLETWRVECKERAREAASKDKTKSPHLSPDDFIFANEVGGFLDTDNFRKRVLYKLARNLELPKLTFQVIRRTIATLAQKKGTVKDVQGVMRHSRTTTTTDVYMQEIPESVRATVNSINAELRNSSKTGGRKSVKAMSDAVLVGGKPLKRGAVSVKVFGNLTPNDTKLGRRSLASC